VDPSPAERVWDPTFGARSLELVTQRKTEDELVPKLLAAEIGGGQKVTVDAAGKALQVSA
jgi:ATP-dependent Clp protease ATP-binding subunit ClpA